MSRRFLRNSRDKIAGGVCSGLADYVSADVTLIRLITLFGIIASGILPGLLLYFICIIIVPLDTNTPSDTGYDNFKDDRNNATTTKNTRITIGICLILIGAFFFARTIFAWIRWEYGFAALLIIGGLYLLLGNRRDG